MICSNCGKQNPNGYTGLCRYCRSPLEVTPAPVVKKKEEKPKLAKLAKTAKKVKATKKA